MEKPILSQELSYEELEAIERIFRVDLPKSPIDLDEYVIVCENDETATELLQEMIHKCLDYTVDVSNMERYALEHPGEKGEDFESVDKKRSNTHDAMISSANIFSRYILKNNLKKDSFISWDTANRGAYGKFAILLTLNIFKDKILIDLVKKKSPDGQIDTAKLRQGANEQEILVLDYVDILCEAENANRPLEEIELEKLSNIEESLGQTPDKILGAFHTIYMKRY